MLQPTARFQFSASWKKALSIDRCLQWEFVGADFSEFQKGNCGSFSVILVLVAYGDCSSRFLPLVIPPVHRFLAKISQFRRGLLIFRRAACSSRLKNGGTRAPTNYN